LYKTTQIFTWYKNSEVKVKISLAFVKRRLSRHRAHGTIDRSIVATVSSIATVLIATVLLQLSSVLPL
jgi:hypothetical protein